MKYKITALAAAAIIAISSAAGIILTASAAGIRATQDSSDFLTDCSSRAGYDYLGTMKNGKALQRAYDKMCDAAEKLWNDTDRTISNLQNYYYYAAIPYDGLTYDEMGIVYVTFKNDFPLYYFAEGLMVGDAKNFYMVTDISYIKGSARAKAQQDIREYITSTAKKAESAESVYEKALIIHNAINNDLEYAYDSEGAASGEPWAHNILGACCNGKGVCECYARTFQAVMNYLDIDNYFVSGKTDQGDHAWNAVRMDDGKCYYVDCTWDDVSGRNIYFAKGKRTMSADHKVDVPCDDPLRFFIKLPDISYTDLDPQTILSERETGDINGDETVNVTDISIIAAHIKSVRPLYGINLKYADITGDGKVNISDLSKLAAKVKGKS